MGMVLQNGQVIYDLSAMNMPKTNANYYITRFIRKIRFKIF